MDLRGVELTYVAYKRYKHVYKAAPRHAMNNQNFAHFYDHFKYPTQSVMILQNLKPIAYEIEVYIELFMSSLKIERREFVISLMFMYGVSRVRLRNLIYTMTGKSPRWWCS